MSVLGTNTLWGTTNYNSFYIPNQAPPVNVSSIGAQYPQTNANISSIFTDHISIDGIGLDGSTANGGQLLINGVAVATVNQNVSSIANWATYPALSSIVYSSGGGTGGTINMAAGQFSTINNTSSITAGVITASTVSASVVNALNIQTDTTSATGSTVTISPNSAASLISTGTTFRFVSGGTYLITIPFSASYNTPTFQGANQEGDIKFFGCSASAFPIVSSGLTPGFAYTVFNSATSLNSIFGTVSFVATAAATATEALQIAAVPVGGLIGVVVNATIQPTSISKIAVVRLA
jgi:hypothetical protein